MFKEELPDQCPPAEAIDHAYPESWRMIRGATALPDHFLSHAAQGMPCPTIGLECRFSSCSLFLDKDSALSAMKKLPRLRKKFDHLALLQIPSGAGMSAVGQNGHIDFWWFRSFDPVGAVISIEELT